MKISFDFDNTLDTPLMQSLAKKFTRAGNEVYITTSRHPKGNQDLFDLAYELDIPKSNIRFTQNKPDYLQGFDMHFDDDRIEVNEINKTTDCLGIHYNSIITIKNQS